MTPNNKNQSMSPRQKKRMLHPYQTTPWKTTALLRRWITALTKSHLLRIMKMNGRHTRSKRTKSKKFCISAKGMLQLTAIVPNCLSLLGATLFLIGSAAFLPQFGSISARVGNWTYRFGSSSYATSSIIGIIALLYRSSTHTSSGDIVTMMTVDKWLNMALMFNYMGGALMSIIGGVFFLKDIATPASIVWAVGSGFFLSG
jgi:hypothetical protein